MNRPNAPRGLILGIGALIVVSLALYLFFLQDGQPDSPDNKAKPDLSISPLNDNHLRVDLLTAKAKPQLSFNLKSGGLRSENWQPISEQLVVTDDQNLTKPASNADYSWQIGTDKNRYDRVYPSAFISTDISVINLDYWLYQNMPKNLIVRSAAPIKLVTSRCETSEQQGLKITDSNRAIGRYLLLATDKSVCKRLDKIAYMSFEDVPEWINVEIENTAPVVYEKIKTVFGQYPSQDPVIVSYASLSNDRSAGFHGDAGWNGFMFLRFYGSAWKQYDDLAAKQTRAFVAHELVHLWLGQDKKQATGNTFNWFYEGAAEFLSNSLLTQPDKEQAPYKSGNVSKRFNDCFMALGGRNLIDAAREKGRLPYDCGYVFHWLSNQYDQVLQGRNPWERWQVAMQHSHSGILGLNDYLEALSDEERLRHFLEPLLSSHDVEMRLDTLADRLELLGYTIKITDDFNAAWSLKAIFLNILSLACHTGPLGYTIYDDYIELDTADRCGVLNGDPKISHIQGYSVSEVSTELYDSVSRACLKDGKIILGVYQKDMDFEIPCQGSLKPQPKSFQVQKAISGDVGEGA